MKRNSVFAVILACVLCLITGCTSTSNVPPPTIEPTPVVTVQPTENRTFYRCRASGRGSITMR